MSKVEFPGKLILRWWRAGCPLGTSPGEEGVVEAGLGRRRSPLLQCRPQRHPSGALRSQSDPWELPRVGLVGKMGLLQGGCRANLPVAAVPKESAQKAVGCNIPQRFQRISLHPWCTGSGRETMTPTTVSHSGIKSKILNCKELFPQQTSTCDYIESLIFHIFKINHQGCLFCQPPWLEETMCFLSTRPWQASYLPSLANSQRLKTASVCECVRVCVCAGGRGQGVIYFYLHDTKQGENKKAASSLQSK